jgi:ABC-2 type transport system ATP-binding protein
MTDAVKVEDLDIDRGGRRILDALSFSIRSGSVTGLLGPSGSGKTTLMRAIVGVQRLQRGRVTVLDRPAGAPDLRRRVGYVTQAPSIYSDLTVHDNIAYFTAIYDTSKEKAEQTLGKVGLTSFADQLAGDLSGGEQARLSLACSLIATPELLVLDEPTVGLDPVLRADLWKLFHALASAGVTLVVSSHVMDEAARCDRLLLLRDGRLLADETPDELRAATGSDDLEEAFRLLILTQEVEA